MGSSTLKIEGARFIITVDKGRRIIQDGSILIEGQRITKVGKADEMADVTADRTIDAHEMVITPGFTNGHMHVSYAHATRGIFPDDLGPEYLPNVFRLQSIMTEEEEYYTSLLGITELLKYGTTTFVDPGSTKFLDAGLQAYEKSGCRIIVGWQVVDGPNPLNLPIYSTQEAIEWIEKTIKTYDHRLDDKVRAWAMPFSAGFASDELLIAAKGLADKYGTGMTLHHVIRPESADASMKQYGKRPTEHLEDIGVLGPNLLLSHAMGLDEAELDAIQRTDTKVVMNPTAAVKGGMGIASKGMLPEMIERGIGVGIGTDAGNNSNLVESMRAMYLMAILYKDGRQNVKMIPAETAIELATISGARSLGLDDQIGSIETGKKADLVLFDTKRPEWRTLFNPVNNLVYNADGRSVHTVIVDGQVVVENHIPTFVNEWELIKKVQEIGEDMLARTGVEFPQRWPIV